MGQLQDESFDTRSVPSHLHYALWVPMPKRADADEVGHVSPNMPLLQANAFERLHLDNYPKARAASRRDKNLMDTLVNLFILLLGITQKM